MGTSWENSRGQTTTDVGAELLRELTERELPWRALTRLNTLDLQPLFFAVYGDQAAGPVVYHHGAGFRAQKGGRVRTKVRPAIIPRGCRCWDEPSGRSAGAAPNSESEVSGTSARSRSRTSSSAAGSPTTTTSPPASSPPRTESRPQHPIYG